MEEQINRFITKLASFTSSKDYCNFYSYEDSSNELRRNNLRIYLHEIARFKPRVMLIGEAPGYQGTRHTGVPFGSESIVLEGVPRLGLFGPGKGYAISTSTERVHKEPTSTIMWATLSEQNFVPLLWAAFPFHPFRLGDELSNRAPTKREVELGEGTYQDLAEIFGISRMVALGNVAHASLAKVGVEIEKIRHPSHGGKTEFGNGIKRIAEDLNEGAIDAMVRGTGVGEEVKEGHGLDWFIGSLAPDEAVNKAMKWQDSLPTELDER